MSRDIVAAADSAAGKVRKPFVAADWESVVAGVTISPGAN
jgi:hypothetical protein